MNDFGKVFGGFLAGAAVGAVAALLFAPQEGAKTREDIMKFATESAEKVSAVAKEKKAEIMDIAKEKGAHINKAEIQAFCEDVIGRVRGLVTSAKLEAAVEEALEEQAEAQAEA